MNKVTLPVLDIHKISRSCFCSFMVASIHVLLSSKEYFYTYKLRICLLCVHLLRVTTTFAKLHVICELIGIDGIFSLTTKAILVAFLFLTKWSRYSLTDIKAIFFILYIIVSEIHEKKRYIQDPGTTQYVFSLRNCMILGKCAIYSLTTAETIFFKVLKSFQWIVIKIYINVRCFIDAI